MTGAAQPDVVVRSPDRPARQKSTGPGPSVVYTWELRKLAAQARTRTAAAVCLVAPFLFVALLDMQDSVPQDTLFGRWVHASGFAIPLVILGFAGSWVFPLLTSLVAGDIFSSEDHYGTWKMILTRSCRRSDLFIGKVLAAATFSVLTVFLLAGSSLAAGVLLVGHQPLVGLSGTMLAPAHAAAIVLESWASVLLPVLGFTALGTLLSIVSRSSAVGIAGTTMVGLLMQLYSILNGPEVIRLLLLSTPITAWHGFPSAHPYYGPLLQGALTSVGYIAGCVSVGYLILRRRAVTEG